MSIYTPELDSTMEGMYRCLNTDLMLVIAALLQDDILNAPMMEKKIRGSLEEEVGWNFSSIDIGKTCNKLFESNVLARYKKERAPGVEASQAHVAENLYCYSVNGGRTSDFAVIATAALKVLSDNDASVVELTQSKVSVNTIKLLVAMFPHSLLDSGPVDFANYCAKFDVGDYGPTYSELRRKTDLAESTLSRHLDTLTVQGYIRKVENPKVYRVVGDLLQYCPGRRGGGIDVGLRKLVEEGRLVRGGDMETFTVSDLRAAFETAPSRRMLARKVDALVDDGYFSVERQSEPDYWELEGKGGRVGLSFAVPLQRFLMGYADLAVLRTHANILYSNPLDLKRSVTRSLSRYAVVSGHVGKPGTK